MSVETQNRVKSLSLLIQQLKINLDWNNLSIKFDELKVSTKKEDFKPDSKKVLRKRRFRNSLIMLLYIDVLLIFLFLNSWISQLLIILTGNQIENNF